MNNLSIALLLVFSLQRIKIEKILCIHFLFQPTSHGFSTFLAPNLVINVILNIDHGKEVLASFKLLN